MRAAKFVTKSLLDWFLKATDTTFIISQYLILWNQKIENTKNTTIPQYQGKKNPVGHPIFNKIISYFIAPLVMIINICQRGN